MKTMTIAALAAVAALISSGAAIARAKPNQRQIGDMTGQCVAGAQPVRARALLATLPGSPAEQRAAKRLQPTFDACSDSAYQLTAGQRDAGLFNGRADLAAAMALDAAATGRRPAQAGEAWYMAAAKAAPKDGYDGFLLGVQEFGACVVAADASDALKLLAAAAGSAEERAAVTALRPVLSPCVGQGSKLNFTRDDLRLAVAEPLYHALTDGPEPAAVR